MLRHTPCAAQQRLAPSSHLRIFAAVVLIVSSPLSNLTARSRDTARGSDLELQAAGSIEPALIAHWPLNDASGTTAFDRIGGYTAVLTNGASWTSGRLGGAVYMDGSDDYLALPALDIYGAALTLAAWVNTTDHPTTVEQAIISKSDAASGSQYWQVTQVRDGGRTLLRFVLRAGGSIQTLVAPANDMRGRAWCHVAATYDGSAMRLFLNGQEIGRVAKSGSVDANATVAVEVGRASGESAYLRGLVDDLRIYSRALTAADLRAVMEDRAEPASDTTAPSVPSNVLASAASPTDVNVQWSPSADDSAVAGYRVHRNGVAVATTEASTYADAGLRPATTYEYSVTAFDAAGNESARSGAAAVTTPPQDALAPKISSLGASDISASEATIAWVTDEPATSVVDYGITTKYRSSLSDYVFKTTHSIRLRGLKPATTYHYRVTSSDPAGNATRSKDATFTTTASPVESVEGPVAYWRLDEGAGTTSSDSAGDLVASLAGGAAWVQGRLGFGVGLDGTSGYIATPSFEVPGSSLTIAAWVKHTAFPAGIEQRIIARSAGAAEADHYLLLTQTAVAGVNRLRFTLKTDSVTTLIATSGDLPLGRWYHAAATYDGLRMRLYLNGVEVGGVSKSGPLATTAGMPMNIGRHPDGSHYLAGEVDDVRIYNRALTTSEISSVITEAGPAPADSTPPSAPAGLKVSAASATEIHLGWTSATDDIGVMGYVISRNGVVIGRTPALSYADSGLRPSTTYGYTVAAFDEAGNLSADSLPVAETTRDSDTIAPRISNLVATQITDSAATVSWTTDEASSSTLDYGLTTAYGAVLTETTPSTSHSIRITGLEAGRTYHYRVTSIDAAGNASQTGDMVFVTAATNQPPSVAITSPATGTALTALSSLTVTAVASDPENRLAEVQFYAGSVLLGRDTTAPFSYTWLSVPAGAYALTAVARDSDGASSTSAPVSVSATGVTAAPWKVAFIASADHETKVVSYVLQIFAEGADLMASAPVRSVDLGKPAPDVNREIVVDQTALFEALAAGNYVLSVRAVGSDGGSASSAPLPFTR